MKNKQLVMRNSLDKIKDMYKQYLKGLVNIENLNVNNYENGFLLESISSLKSLADNGYGVSLLVCFSRQL